VKSGPDTRRAPGAVRAMRLGVGFVVFQGAWFACVLGAARGTPGLGIVAVVAAVGTLVALGGDRRSDLQLIAIAVVIGAVWDGLLARTGTVVYASAGPWPGWAPGWILALWALFAPMLRDPLRWLHGRPWLAALVGGAGGAASYAAAARLGACAFPDPVRALSALGAGWSLIVPVLLAVAQRLERGGQVAAGSARAGEVRA
jgi:hypothetical protein